MSIGLRGKILLIALASICVFKFCSKSTDGFSHYRVARAKAEGKHPLISESLLEQPFYYLGKGAQLFAFESEDGKVVLKLFRKPRIHFSKHTIEKRKAKQNKDFESYELAYEKLQNETGLLHLHLRKTGQRQRATIYDKLGRKTVIDLDQVAFAVQKRAELLYPRLEKRIASNEIEKAKEELKKIIDLLRLRIDRKIYDKDPNLKTNFGFVEEDAIQIDFGRFKTDELCEETKTRLIRITDRLVQWLEPRSKELAEFVSESL